MVILREMAMAKEMVNTILLDFQKTFNMVPDSKAFKETMQPYNRDYACNDK